MFRSNTNRKTAMRHDQHAGHARRLQFSHTTRVHFVPPLSDFNQEEIEATWLTEEDSANIQVDTLKTVKRMRRGRDIDEKKYSVRGLEYMRTAGHLEQKKVTKASVCNAVLAEQKRQRLSGCYDPMKICAQSRLHSEISRDEALRLGASDAVAAEVQINPSKGKILIEKNVFNGMISMIYENLRGESSKMNTNAEERRSSSTPDNAFISKAA